MVDRVDCGMTDIQIAIAPHKQPRHRPFIYEATFSDGQIITTSMTGRHRHGKPPTHAWRGIVMRPDRTKYVQAGFSISERYARASTWTFKSMIRPRKPLSLEIVKCQLI